MAQICFDLDGTLVDPLPAIRHALEAVLPPAGLAVPEDARIRPFIGPGMHGLLRELEPDPTRCRSLLNAYWRDFHDQGVFLHQIYDGAHLMLDRLKRQGHQLILVTAKPERIAKALAYHLDLFLVFQGIHGSDPTAPWPDKTAQMRFLQGEGLLKPTGTAIGDRAGDIAAGKALGMRTVGVTYGFGTREELAEAGADPILDTLEALDRWLEAEHGGAEVRDPFNLAE